MNNPKYCRFINSMFDKHCEDGMRNIILSILFLIVFSGDVFSQANQDQFFVIQDFSKGLRSHISEYMTPDGSATDLQNVRVNEKYGYLTKRNARLKVSACHAAPVDSLYRYYVSDDTKHTIATSSTYIDAIDDSGACSTLYAAATDGLKWSFVTYQDLLIGMNGMNNAKKWDGKTQSDGADGARTAGDLVADLGAPFAELNTGTNLDASSWYQYRIAYYNGTYYTYSLARSNPILTDDTIYNITLTDIPLGPSGTTHRYIYRTLGNANRAAVLADTTFYKVATISDNITTTINDAMSDATADDNAAPTWATVAGGYDVTPPKARFAAINNERLFIANDPSGVMAGKSTVYYSPVLRPNYFYYHTDYDLIRADDGDEITFIKNHSGILTIGKTRSISRFYTSGDSNNWTISNPFSFIGCVAPYSAVNGVSGIIYLGGYGIYNFNGQSSELISDVVTDRVRDMLETSQENAVGVYHDNSYYLAYTSASSGSAVNDKVLVFDLTRDAYVEDSMKVNSFAALDSGDDAGTLFSGSSDIDGTIYAHSGSYSKLAYRYLSQIVDGTIYRTLTSGEEPSPLITLGDNTHWEDLGAGAWEDSGSWTWSMRYLAGTWTSPVVQINAAELDKLFWNESLGASGNVTFAVRTGATEAACLSASWSSEVSTPSGSDISTVDTGNFVQIRASLSTTSWTESPALFMSDSYMIRMTYKKSGTDKEPAFLSLWSTGKTTMGVENPKRIKEFQIYYAGTEGILTITYTTDNGTTGSFNIDLSVSPSASKNDAYFGTEDNKIFQFVPEFTSQPVGRQWQFTVSETGTVQWKVKRIVARVGQEPYTIRRGDL